MSIKSDPKNRLVLALDEADQNAAFRLVKELRDEVGLFKVGLQLYFASQTSIVADLIHDLGVPPERLFLDLKLYDIPGTVIAAVRTLFPGLAFLTLPSDVGFAALADIVHQGKGRQRFLAVTVLTSTTPDDLARLGYRAELAEQPEKLVVKRARLAQEAGCVGVVCSGREVRAVKAACGPDFLVVCPGIRPSWSMVPGDDQRRVVTPLEAVQNGADYIVVGRPIRRAPDPVAAARQVTAEIAAGLAAR
ncbi:MAG: orotidine-5'-phosphate decarboxylase [Desulfobaccales bacterium]